VLAPILVRSGALLGDKNVSPSYVEEQMRNAGIGTILHGMSLLPITLPVSAFHLLSAPVAIPYRFVFSYFRTGYHKPINIGLSF